MGEHRSKTRVRTDEDTRTLPAPLFGPGRGGGPTDATRTQKERRSHWGPVRGGRVQSPPRVQGSSDRPSLETRLGSTDFGLTTEAVRRQRNRHYTRLTAVPSPLHRTRCDPRHGPLSTGDSEPREDLWRRGTPDREGSSLCLSTGSVGDGSGVREALGGSVPTRTPVCRLPSPRPFFRNDPRPPSRPGSPLHTYLPYLCLEGEKVVHPGLQTDTRQGLKRERKRGEDRRTPVSGVPAGSSLPLVSRPTKIEDALSRQVIRTGSRGD